VEGAAALIAESQVGARGSSLLVPATFRHHAGMVGPPKTLQDLRRVEGAVRVTCRACKAVKQHDLEELIIDRRSRRISKEWEAVRHGTACSAMNAGRMTRGLTASRSGGTTWSVARADRGRCS
jgi:hypothetical protein